MSAVKDQLKRMAKELREDATWEDVMEAVYLQRVVADGLKDLREGRVYSSEEIRKDLGLKA